MKKRISAVLLGVVLCFAPLVPAYAAGGSITVSGTAGATSVAVTASGLDANTTYAMCNIVQGSELMALFNLTTDASGTYTGVITTGTLTSNATLKVSIPDQAGTGEAAFGTGTVTPGGSVTPPTHDGDGGSTGGGGGGGSSSNSVKISSTANGTVIVSPSNPSKGTAVTVTTTPKAGYQLGSLTVTDSDGNRIAVTDKGNGKFTFVMPGSKVTISADFVKAAADALPFTDVQNGTYYYDAVAWAVKQGITSGTSATTFAPDASCTRAQVVTFLWRANGSPAASASSRFSDVDSGTYYASAVAWAVSQGITSGTGADMFSPDEICTRAQIVTFLWRINGSPAASVSSRFSDVDNGAYYAAAVAWAVQNGVTVGTGTNTFAPDTTCTRAQVVTFLFRALAK